MRFTRSPMALTCRLFWRVCLIGVVGWTATGCSYLTTRQNALVNDWLLCDDCVEGELDSVVALHRRAVPKLSKALYGPSDEQAWNMRNQFGASYSRLNAWLPDSVGETPQAYVSRYLDNYLAVYQSRSAIALGRIGTPYAILALRRAARRQEFREDVRETIAESLSEAEVEELQVVRGDSQVGTVGSTLATDPTVSLIRTDLPVYQLISLVPLFDRWTAPERPMSGDSIVPVEVLFAPDPGSGSVSRSAVVSNFGREVAVRWTLGSRPGVQRLHVRAGRHNRVFTAFAQPAVGALLGIHGGDAQRAPIGTAVRTRPSVIVTDGRGNPIAGDTVAFTPAAGGGSVTDSLQVTGRMGIATVGSWTLGPAIRDTNRLAAVLSRTADTVIFRATTVPPVPASMTAIAGDNQTAEVGTSVETDPTVRVADTSGYPVEGKEVMFTVIEGGGSVSSVVVYTDESGAARVRWTLGAEPGTNRLAARAVDLPTAVFTATAVSPP